MKNSPEDLCARLIGGERLALARLISWAENADPRFAQALGELYPRIGRAWRWGVTGPPGAGKSTLVNSLAKTLRARDETVAILAVDPSSPFTGGALLGDRIRMEERTSDPGVFIRSMASRGSHGGLARATVDACDVMDAFGFDHVLIETVGVGQAEYDVVGAADSVLVVSCPGAGDGVQAMKAGLLEVADILVVNKADRPGSDRLVLELEEAVHVRNFDRGRTSEPWVVPVVSTVAQEGRGVEDVIATVARHRAAVEATGLEAVRAQKRLEQVRRVVGERLDEVLWGSDYAGTDKMHGSASQQAVEALRSGQTPYDVATHMLSSILGDTQASGGTSASGERNRPEAARP